MDAAGIPRPAEVHYGKLIRYGRPKKKFWYVFHEYRARNGRYFIAGAFGRWEGEQNVKFRVETDFRGIDEDERERLARSIAQQQADAEAKAAARAADAAKRARAQWKSAALQAPGLPGGAHGPVRTYLDRKGVTPERVRWFADGTMLVRMLDITAPRPRIKGLQKIAPDGSKLFTKHMQGAGAVLPLGNVAEGDRVAVLCEGYATARSIRMALAESTCVFVAFTAGNLLPAARAIRARFPDLHLVVAADDDAYLESRLNKRLAHEYGVAFSEAQQLYKVGYHQRRTFTGRAGEVGLEAQWVNNEAGESSVVGAFHFDGRAHTFAMTNAGLVKANECAETVGNASVVLPQFAQRELPPLPDCPRFTDFNDLHLREGLAVVKAQIEAAILAALAGVRHAVDADASGASPGAPGDGGKAGDARGGKGRRDRKSRAASPASGAGGGGDDEDGGGRLFRPFRDGRFTYVYPTDTAFDHELAKVVRLGALRNAYTKPVVDWWLGWSGRRTVNIDQVVFDPVGARDPAQVCNLFRGLEAKPKASAAGCEKLLDLLYYLCGEDREDANTPVGDWVLRWAAYPLQHVGAKMRTAVVMYGEEGTGKNLFWSALLDLYGRYGGIIGQNQLNSQFNTWLTAKLFLVANEVVTAQERSYYVGYLKNLITEDTIHVEPKGIDSREESNHCNFVFLSNEIQPLKIGPRDRRFMVIKTPLERGRAFYEEVGAELRAGGAYALYRYLLDLDLGEFGEHTKPLATEAREALIEVSMNSVQLYWKHLHDGELPMRYGPAALFDDVYQGYRIWCDRNGERMPISAGKFSENFKSMNGVKRTPPIRVRDPDAASEAQLPASELPQRKVFLMGDQAPPTEGRREWLDGHIAAWREALKSYRGRGRHGGRPGEGGDHEPF